MRLLFLMVASLLPACATESAYVAPPCVFAAGPAPVTAVPLLAPVDVLLLEGHHAGGVSEVIGIVDVHAGPGGEAQAIAELKGRAAAMGADAVVGVEFHHAETASEPKHLSGTAIRFISLPAR